MDLTNRVVLVTGAGRRIGKAIALEMAEHGARLAIHYNASHTDADEVVARITALGGVAQAFGADLSDPQAPEALMRDVVAEFGTLDVLVNSAAMMMRTPVGEVTPEQWDTMFALNLRAPFFLAQAAASVMRASGVGGVLINIADLAAFETWRDYIPHSISKAGIVQMTRALAHALAPEIRVNAVAPGAILMPEGWDAKEGEHLASTTPLKRLGTPHDIASAVRYLIEADYITGETLIVDGGRHVRK